MNTFNSSQRNFLNKQGSKPSPITLTKDIITQYSIQFKWTGGINWTSYNYYTSLTGLANSWTSVTPYTAETTLTSGGTANVTGLFVGTIYYIYITATNIVGTTTSNTINVATLPDNITLTQGVLTQTTFPFTWTGGTGWTSYNYYRSLTGLADSWTLVTPSPVSPLTSSGSGTIITLSPGTLYYIYIAAINTGGTTISNTINATTVIASPSAITLQTGMVSASNFPFTWTGGTGWVSYKYYKSLTNLAGSWTEFIPKTVSELASSGSGVFDKIIGNQTTYIYIAATNIGGTTISNTITGFTYYPSAITDLSAINITDLGCDISWNGGLYRENVQNSTLVMNAGTVYDTIAKTGIYITENTTTSQGPIGYYHASLAPSKTYTLRVEASFYYVYTTTSATTLTITTLVARPAVYNFFMQNTANFYVTLESTNSLRVSWYKHVEGITYTFYYSTSSTGPWTVITPTTVTLSTTDYSNAMLGGLSPGYTYYAYVTATNSSGSVTSGVLNATTCLGINTITSLQFNTGSNSSYKVYWTAGTTLTTGITYELIVNNYTVASSNTKPSNPWGVYSAGGEALHGIARINTYFTKRITDGLTLQYDSLAQTPVFKY